MKIHELIRKLESVTEKHGNINVAISIEDNGHYIRITNVQINKNKSDVLDGYPIIELDDQAILIIR